MKKTLITFIILLSLKALAQDAPALQSEKMKSLAIWVGSWKGEGWMLLPNGQKHFFHQIETVTSKFDGRVLNVEGSGKDKETGKAIHDAVGFLTFDVIKQQYRFTAMTGTGYITDVVPQVNTEGFIWTLNNPRAGIMKYTIKLSKTEWIEIGELTNDGGKTWIKNFEMILKRK